MFYSVNQLLGNSFFNAQKCHYEYYPDNCILLLSFLFQCVLLFLLREISSNSTPFNLLHLIMHNVFFSTNNSCASIYISTMYFLFKLDIFVSALSGNKTTAAFYQIYCIELKQVFFNLI